MVISNQECRKDDSKSVMSYVASKVRTKIESIGGACLPATAEWSVGTQVHNARQGEPEGDGGARKGPGQSP